MFEKELSGFCRKRRSIFYLKTDIEIPDEILSSLRNRKIEDINEQILAGICKEVFNTLPLSIAPLSNLGTFHTLYRITLPDDLSCVLRINVLDLAHRGFYFYIDEWVMEILKQKGLPSLQIYFIDLSRKLFPFDYEIVEQAKGRPVSEIEISKDFDKGLLSQLGKTAAKLHTIETELFGPLDVRHVIRNKKGRGIFHSWGEYIFLNLDKHIDSCYKIGAVNSEESKRIKAVFDHMYPLLERITPSLLHGDLGNHNIFSDGKRITAIVDWEDCLSGDPIFDIAFWGTFHANDTDERRQLFIKGYRSLRRLPDDFEVMYWLYYLRIALSKTVHRYRFKYPDRPGLPPTSQRIQKGLREVELLIS